MQETTFLSLIASVSVLALATQVPLRSSYRPEDTNKGLLTDGSPSPWNLNNTPNLSDTDHLVFETVYSLLQHWPNTRMRNGHNIVPGIIPKGTLLYHGANTSELPPSPNWLATDPEHSYIFCNDGFNVDRPQPGCWQLTLTTTRPLKVVYFDGSSAAKIPYGTLDTEDLLARGKIDAGTDIYDDLERVRNLCEWGKPFDVDGFVRMEMDFEVVLCDLATGVSVVSRANLVSWKVTIPVFPTFVPFEVMNGGSWHNHLPGETRVQLDLAGLVSLYDTELVPSLVAVRAGQERWDHRTGNISSKDLSAVKSRLEAALIRPSGQSSGIEWRTLFHVIVNRFAGRLELARYFLNSSTVNTEDILSLANKTQTQLRIMLTPYILLSATPKEPSDRTDLNWAIPIYKLCATVHTKSLESELDTMTDSEKLLLRAVRGTSREICRVVTKMWAAGVYAGIDQSLNTKESPDIAEVKWVWSEWEEDLNRLMTWLDWSVWIKCNPRCGPEEMCYLPTWPVGFPWFLGATTVGRLSSLAGQGRLTSFDLRAMAMERLTEELLNVIRPGPDDWMRPEPRCVRRVDPYDLEPVYDGNK